jgi:hypothetical protein
MDAVKAFDDVKLCIADACVICPNEIDLLVLESDASDFAVSASLNQGGKPVAFFSRTLKTHERRHAPVEKEACAIIEACRKWRHYLTGRRFLLITDQQAVSYMYDSSKHGKIKNDKIMRWKIELSCLIFDIKYRPGPENVTADCLSRAYCSALSQNKSLAQLHEELCHPGIIRLSHFVRNRNLPYSMEDIKCVISQCRACSELKPRFFKPQNPPLIKATQPFERLSMDFKGPLPSASRNKYILTIVDEYSRFPFAYACPNMESSTVIKCLTQLFSIFGMPNYIHNDRGPSLVSVETEQFLLKHGIAFSRPTAYNPRGNGQCERYNGIIWKAVQLALHSRSLETRHWELVIADALHSIRSLLCTATNQTPHERLFAYQRKSTAGNPLPSWLLDKGPVLMKRHIRQSKYDPLVDEVDLIHINPHYANVRLQNGREQSVSLRDLAPLPKTSIQPVQPLTDFSPGPPVATKSALAETPAFPELPSSAANSAPSTPTPEAPLRRSTRKIVAPERFEAGQ